MNPTRSAPSFLALLGCFVSAGVSAKPPAPDAPGARETQPAAVRTETLRWLTGSAEHLQSVVAGAPPTAVLKIVPVDARVGAYPGGTTIVGNELIAFTGGFRVWFEFKLSDWDPDGDNVPPLRIWQIKADNTGYLGANAVPPNPGVDLIRPFVACDDNSPCAAAFGEPWAKCDLAVGACQNAYVDTLGTVRADSWCADTGSGACLLGDCNWSTPASPFCFAMFDNGIARPDGGIEYYGATLVLDVPSSALGKYTVNLDAAESFIVDADSLPNDIPTLSETGFVVNVLANSVQACCLVVGGCSDVDSAACANAGDTPQGAGTDCLTAPCGGPIGACCDQSISSCTDSVLEANCAPPLEWSQGTLCVNLPFPCLTTGACCDTSPGAGGACTDDEFEADCIGPDKTWTANTACAEANCTEAVGGCCDTSSGSAGGLCFDGLTQGQCTGPLHLWSRGVACADIDCVALAGSCCDTATSACIGTTVFESDCQGAELLWRSDATCESCVSGPQLLVTPVPAKVGSYPPGTVIIGQEIYLPEGAGGVRVWFEFQLRSWDLAGDGDPPLEIWQIQIDSTGLLGANADPPNPGVNLTPPVVACSNNAPCVAAFGESWANCDGSTFACQYVYADRAGAGGPDSWCADTGSGACTVSDCNVFDPACFGIYPGMRPDEGFAYYGATMVLDVPTEAAGHYTVNLDTAQTFLADTDIPPNDIPTLSETGFVVHIGTPPLPAIAVPDNGGSRGLVFNVSPLVTATGGDSQTALQVEMVDLHHPAPQNVLSAIPFNFTAFDTRYNGTCSAAAPRPGHHCDTDADCRVCVTGSRIGYACASDAQCVVGGSPGLCAPALPVGVCSPLQTCAEPVNGAQGGCSRWVGPPQAYMNAVGVPSRGIWYGSRLQCTPFYYDWATIPKLAVISADIVPSSEYAVRSYPSSCKGTEASCGFISPPEIIRTRRSGDVLPPFNPPDPTSQPDGNDIAQVVGCFKANAGLYKPDCMLAGHLPPMSLSISGADVSIAVDAFRLKRFQYAGPCPCPSNVTCAACSAGSTCATGQTCQRRCTGGPHDLRPCEQDLDCGTCTAGTNAGFPCAVSAECGTGGVCDAHACMGGTLGVCVDACGRCSP